MLFSAPVDQIPRRGTRSQLFGELRELLSSDLIVD